jgi:hypothetical protein
MHNNNSFTKLYSRFNNQEYRQQFNKEYVEMLSEIKNNKFNLKIDDYVKVYTNVIKKQVCDEFSERIKNEKLKYAFSNPMTDLLRTGKYINIYAVDSTFKSFSKNTINDISTNIGEKYIRDVRPFYYAYGDKLSTSDAHILDYSKDDFFRIHHDHYAESLNFSRLLTVCSYLNDDYEGGLLEFPSIGKTYKFKKGDVIVFPSNWLYYHGVTPITAGNRYTVVFWLGIENGEL